MKILELTNFSAGGDGVFGRVKQESILLAKKDHEVQIFSSNFTKGSEEIASPEEKLGLITIKRFPTKKLGGESFMRWDFTEEALKFKPDVIIAHAYRHFHTSQALKIAKKIGCKVFLVTHAPFARSQSRSAIQKTVVWLYDKLIAPKKLNKFNKVIAITKWEIPYLKALGVKEEKIAYIPNGIPIEFLTRKAIKKEENKILYFGRVSPIKNLETAIQALPLIQHKSIKLEIAGPAEQDYFEELKQLIEGLKLESRVSFTSAIFNVKEKISKFDSCKIFVLPSKMEGMPQVLIEALARGKIVVVSDNLGTKDLIKKGKNGFLFSVGNAEDLAHKIDSIMKIKSSEIKKIKTEARKSVEQFSWDKIIEKIERLINKPDI